MSDPIIKLKKAAVAAQGGSCGGILTDDDIKSGVPANWIGDVDEADRIAGWLREYKGFVKKETTNPVTNGWLIISRPSEALDYYRICGGTPIDVWSAASGYAGALWFGSGELAVSGTIGQSSFLADFEVASGLPASGTVFLLDRTINKWERFAIASRSWAGTRATVAIAGATTRGYPVKARAFLVGTAQENFSLSGMYLCIRIDGSETVTVYFTTEVTAQDVADSINLAASGYVTASAVGGYLRIERDLDYYHHYFQCVAGAEAMEELGLASTERRGSDGTIVAAGLSLGTLAASVTMPSVTAASGTFDNSTYPILANEEGGVDDDFVLTFLDATHYSISGTLSGVVVQNHLISTDCAPAHWSGVYFTIDASAFGGTFGVGNTITFSTVSASKGFWLKAVGPAGAAAMDMNRAGLKVIGSV